MIQVNISQARQTLPSLVNKVYQGEEFVIVKNKIPVAQLIPIVNKKIGTSVKKIVPKATKLFRYLKGSNIEIADKLRKSAWRGNYGH